MILSKQWLSTRVDLIGVSNDALAHALTHAGFEVEEVKPLVKVSGCVIGRVLTCINHPDSDHLHLTTVDVGDEVIDVVCGASNVREGITVIVARVGAQLPGLTIKATTVRGKPSMGMICSYSELGLDDKFIPESMKEGIAILDEEYPLGMDALEALGWDDTLFDISLTPNRANANSLIAMAWEVSAILNRDLIAVPHEHVVYDVDHTPLSITSTTSGCPQFLGRIIEEVTLSESPRWLKNILMAYNIKSINNVVDISNLVMLETGHPLHFYDRTLLNNDHLGASEGFLGAYTALDEITYELLSEDVCIVSEEEIVGLGGIIGGDNSKILNTTKSIIIEVAEFDPMRIKATSKRLQIQTDAAARFSKFIDPVTSMATMERATYYLKTLANAKGIHPIVALAPLANEELRTISLSLSFINKLCGTTLSVDQVFNTLSALGFDPSEESEMFEVNVPSHRDDIVIKEDVVEEIIRVIGYSKIPSTPLSLTQTVGKLDSMQMMRRQLQHALTGMGLNEVVTYTLMHERYAKGPMSYEQPHMILSPLSEDRKMIRNHLYASTLLNVANAQSYKNTYNSFEISNVYFKGGYKVHCSIALTKPVHTNTILKEKIGAHVFTLKGMIETLLSHLGFQASRLGVQSMDEDSLYLHPYQSAWLTLDQKRIGYVGVVHPTSAKAFDVKQTLIAELDLSLLHDLKKGKIAFEPLSKLQTITKDIALVLDKSIPSASIIKTILKAGKPFIDSAVVFDLFTMSETTHSMALTLSFKNNQGYTQAQIEEVMSKVLKACELEHKASIRS
ncbi:MAG: phenylalanine--tRNA ligase subunit beta [Erysipelothrix sp.]|jgi:phenylalanyl-tRNA synthetase beta chain|nr:phenylalanine--tRNA ligase subunit beta [Erysipelothrix sp.]